MKKELLKAYEQKPQPLLMNKHLKKLLSFAKKQCQHTIEKHHQTDEIE